MEDLDKVDRRILHELDRNARQSISQLARIMTQGRDRIEYRIDKLQNRGIIQQFGASINVYKLGFTIHKSYLRLETNSARVAEFIRYLHKHPRLYWVAVCDGRWDLIIAVAAINVREFHAIHSKIVSEFNDVILDFNGYTIAALYYYTRNYLTQGKGNTIFLGGDSELSKIDKTDVGILKVLAKDARTSTTEIADRLKISPQVVKYRIQNLEQEGIIAGYPIELNLQKIGMLLFKIQFFLRDYELDLRKRFSNYCKQHPNIVAYIEQIGDCPVEIEVEVRDYQQFSEIVSGIRTEFSKLINNFHSVRIQSSWCNPIPQDLAV